MSRRRLLYALALALPALACSTTANAPPGCPAGQKLCGGACVDVTSSASHCGACELSCAAPLNGGSAACVDGLCSGTCAAGFALCGARLSGTGSVTLLCADTGKDPGNCGGCGQVCLPQQSCQGGVCTSCPSGQLDCPVAGSPGVSACRAVLSDSANCGGCGNVCGAGSRCDNGVCAGAGLSNCGDLDGGAAVLADLENDPKNCGGCARPDLYAPGNADGGLDPHVCQAGESCKSGDCIACGAGAVCGNVCVDPSLDPTNCGACGAVCTGTDVCVSGACGAGLRLTLLPPVSKGLLPTKQIFAFPRPLVRVDSRLPLQAVTLDVTFNAGAPDGGPADGGHYQLVTVSDQLGGAAGEVAGPGGAASLWATTADGTALPALSPADGGARFAFQAVDQAFRPDAGDARLHTASASIDVFPAPLPPDGGVFSTTVSIGGVVVPDGGSAFVPLNAGPIEFTSTTNIQGLQQVVFGTFGVSAFYATAAFDGGTATIVQAPGDLTTASGGANVAVSCPTDEFGQAPQGVCTLGVANASLFVGRVPYPSGGNPPVMTALPDGGAPSVLYATDGGAIVAIDAAQPIVSATPNTNPLPQTSPFAGYSLNSLVPAETSAAALATKADGSSIDRFDCAAGACTRTTLVSKGAVPLGPVLATTGKAVLFKLAPSTVTPVAFAFPAGAVAAAPVPANGGLATVASGAPAFGALDSGAIVAAINTGNQVQITLAHPATGVVAVGAPFSGVLSDLVLKPTGELLWHFTTGNSFFVAGAFFDGVSVPSTTPVAAVGSAGPFAWQRVKGRVLAGTGSAASGTLRLLVADLGRKTIYAPASLLANVGQVTFDGVLGRDGDGAYWSVSDDQLKLLWVSTDPLAGGGFTKTLWLTDLATADASTGSVALASAPGLIGSGGSVDAYDWSPHFVHSALGASAVTERADGVVAFTATPHAVVWGETVLTGPNPYLVGVRASYAVYQSDASPPFTATFDGYAVGYRNLGAALTGVAQESAAAAELFFYDFDSHDLYGASLTASAAGATSRVGELPFWFGLREETRRFLMVRGDGVMVTAPLQPGVNPATKATVVTEGLLSGWAAPGVGRQGLQLVGFTPDGDHAFAFGQLGGDLSVAFTPATAVLQTFDLTGPGAPARADFGRVAAAVSGFVPQQAACVLSNGSFAASARPVNLQNPGALRVLGAYAATGPGRLLDLGLPAFDASGLVAGPTLGCQVSVDGTEGAVGVPANRAAVAPITFAALSPAASAGPLATNFSAPVTNPATAFKIAPFAAATYSPFGGPYLDEYQVLPITRGQLATKSNPAFPAAVYKLWGEAASNGGAAYPFITVATSFVPAVVTAGTLTRHTDQDRALLYHYTAPNDPNGVYPMALPLAGRPIPAPPLP